MVDPSSAGSAASAIKGAMDVLSKARDILAGPDVTIEDQEIIFQCPEDKGEYSIALRVEGGPSRSLPRTIGFPLPELTRMSVRSTPFARSQRDAIRRMEQGFQLHTRYLDDTELFLINFEFELGEHNSIDALVRRDCERDSPGTQDQESYWLNAQLRHPDALNSEFGVIELRDYNFGVDVAVHQDINNVVPHPFERRVKIISEWIQEKHRGRKRDLSREHIRELMGGEKGNETEILANIQDLFIPSNFSSFVDISEPYQYHGAEQGTDFYDDVPFPTFPKHMDVIARTDLTLDSPAAKGELVYKRAEFQEALNEIFPETMQKL